jgi:hypothetical protein
MAQLKDEPTCFTLIQAYEWFNARLFTGRLPGCLLTVDRRLHIGACFSVEPMRHARTGEPLYEISMNPKKFLCSPDRAILSYLAHEMVHYWQQIYGTPGQYKPGQRIVYISAEISDCVGSL